jgi:hypothetical protein
MGHWRVACRRYCLLLACEYPIPQIIQLRCDELLQRCSHRERVQMREDAAVWAAMLGHRVAAF